MKRRTPPGDGLRAALIAREELMLTRPWARGPDVRRRLDALEASQPVQYRGWEMGGLAPGVGSWDDVQVEADGTVTYLAQR